MSLVLSSDFWEVKNPEDEKVLLDAICEGKEQNVHVSAEMVTRWMSMMEEILPSELNAIMELICQHVLNAVFFGVELALFFNEQYGDDKKQVIQTAIRQALSQRREQRFLITMFVEKCIWYFAIIDNDTSSIYWGEACSCIEKIPFQLLDLQQEFTEARRAVHQRFYARDQKFIHVAYPRLDIGNSSAAAIFGIAGILSFLSRSEINGAPLSGFGPVHDSLLRIRVLAALARQTWTYEVVDPTPAIVVSSPVHLNAMVLNIDFYDEDPKPAMLDDFLISRQGEPPEFVQLKGAVVWNEKFDHHDLCLAFIAACALLTANGARCTKDRLLYFLMEKLGKHESQLLPVLLGFTYLAGNIGETPRTTRAIYESPRGYHLTRYGFDTFLAKSEVLLEAGVDQPFRVCHRCRGRKNNGVLQVLSMPIARRRSKATWIGIVKHCLFCVRRPLTINDIAEYVAGHPEIELMRPELRQFEHRKTLVAAIRQGARQGLNCSSQSDAGLGMRANRGAVFYEIKDNPHYYGLLVDGSRLYEHRRRGDPKKNSILEWVQYDGHDPLCQAWVLPRTQQHAVFRMVGNQLHTLIALEKDVLIEGPVDTADTEWPLFSARFGMNIMPVNHGGRWFAEVQCRFEANTAINFHNRFNQ